MKNKRNFYLISITVAVLLLAMIAVQIYWVRNAYQFRKVQYTEMMNRILERVAVYAEEKVYFYLYGRSYINAGEGIMILKTDYKTKKITDTISLFNAFPYYNETNDTCFYSTSVSYYNRPTQVDVALKFIYRKKDTLFNLSEKNKALKKMDLSNFRASLDESTDIKSLLKNTAIDSFLSDVLKREGINENCQYSLYKKGEQVKDTALGKNKDWFTKELFSTIPYVNPYEFSIHLNNRDQWISRSLMSALGISLLISLLLISAFIYFVYTVFRQKRLSEMKTDFINNMTHEFMTPVTNISLAIETLEKKYNEDVLHIIGTENNLLKENINKVLQLAALDKNSYLLDLTEVDIHEILNRVARNFAPQMQEKSGNFIFRLNAERSTVLADETHIINLFYNIVDNAIKYSGRHTLEITISTEYFKGKLHVCISDNGKGMSNEVQELMFERFYRGQKGNRHDVKGFGLGLAYVKSIADAHEISISVGSKTDIGTIFNLWFKQIV